MWALRSTKAYRFNLITLTFFSTATTAQKPKKTFYQILQVTSNATMANIKQNYLRLAKIYHPDVYKGRDKDRFELINEAYRTLSDKAKRSRYDEQLGYRKSQKTESQPFTGSSNINDQKIYAKKPQNPMAYDTYEKGQQKIDLDQQFNKFFGKNLKTKFEQIKLHEQPQIRAMSEQQRIRRHFSQVYQSSDAISKASYQKQFDTILDDQIKQKNRMVDDTLKAEQKTKQRHSEKGVKKLKWKLLLGFSIFTVITLPIIYSIVTKYRLEKQEERYVKQKWEQVNVQAQQADLRARLKYQ